MTRKVLTGDETWISRYDPEIRTLSAVWLFPDELPPPQKSKDHEVHRRKWLPLSSQNRAMSPPFLLRTEEQSLRTGTCIIWYRRCPKTEICDLFLHHDSASAHTAATTVEFLNESQKTAAAAPAVFARRLSLRRPPIPRSEEITEG